MWQKLWVRVKNTIKSTDGAAMSICITAAVLFLMTIFMFMFENERRNILIQSISSNVSEALTSCAANNAYASFPTVRDSTSGSYYYAGTGYAETQNIDAFARRMAELFQTTNNGTAVTRYYPDGSVYWQLRDISISIANASTLEDKVSRYKITYTLVLPRFMLGRYDFTYRQTQYVEYMNRF